MPKPTKTPRKYSILSIKKSASAENTFNAFRQFIFILNNKCTDLEQEEEVPDNKASIRTIKRSELSVNKTTAHINR